MTSRFGKGLTPIKTTSGSKVELADDEVRPDKKELRNKLADDVRKFLEKGGCVQAIPSGYGVLNFGAGVRKNFRVAK